MTEPDFIARAGQRLQAAGYSLSDQQLPGGAALVGYRSRFNLAWMATRLHLFVVMTRVPLPC